MYIDISFYISYIVFITLLASAIKLAAVNVSMFENFFGFDHDKFLHICLHTTSIMSVNFKINHLILRVSKLKLLLIKILNIA